MKWGDKMSRLIVRISIVAIVIGSILAVVIGNRPMQGTGKSLDGGAKYVGIDACKKCHLKQYMSWKKTTMARTFDILKPGKATEAKEKAGLDPKKDFTKDAACLPCHTTGYGLPGGYRIPLAGDAAAAKIAKANEGVTCEGCHGRGSKYVALHTDVAARKRKYSVEEFYAAGMTRIDAAACTPCHNPKNPMAAPDFSFDYEQNKDKGSHENYPLKYRTD